ncbi:hypothetical protein ACFL2Y_01980 [Candidatus Omnitrophota bacterium]
MKLRVASFLAGLNKRQKILFYGAIAFVIFATIDRIVLAPVLGKVYQLDEQIKLKEEEIKRNLSILSQKENLVDEIDKFTSYLSDLQSEEKDVTTFSREIENLAKGASVYLTGIRPAGKREEGITKRYLLELDFEARMEQLFEFFYAIENSDNLTKIEIYHITPKSAESSIATCSMRVSKVIIPKL